MSVSRRDLILTCLGLGLSFAAGPSLARIHWPALRTFGVTPAGGTVDQTAMLQRAIDAAASRGVPLFLPPGVYWTRRLALRSGTHLIGVPDKSILRYCGGGGLIGIEQAESVCIDGLVLDGDGKDMGLDGALLAANKVKRLQVSHCCFRRSSAAALLISCSENILVAGNVVDTAAIGIAVMNSPEGSKPAVVKGNAVRNLFYRKVAPSCGNGIAVDADALVTGNAVENAPGFGILVGGNVRDISVTSNHIRNAHIGIGVPIGIAKAMPIAGNFISGVKDGAVRAMNGPRPVGPDLADRSATS
jgi:hypothetical protein